MKSSLEKKSRPPLNRYTLRLKHHIRVRLRHRHHFPTFLKQTISAQIHALAALASMVAVVILAIQSSFHGWHHVVWSTAFGLSAVLLFTASALMHFFCDGYRVSKRFAELLENFDKFCIHLLIAGTYTALIGISLVDPLRTQMLITVWTFAICGVLYTVFYKRLPGILRSRVLYTAQFLVMGWLLLLCRREMMSTLSDTQGTLLMMGGGLYSVGAVIYVVERPNPLRNFGYHEIWHSLVVLGCTSFFAIVFLAYF